MARLGYPLPTGNGPGGRPYSETLRLFAWCHFPQRGGWQRVEWPDGLPLLAQPWHRVQAFHILADEHQRMNLENKHTSPA
ncbi:MAG: hypothetical protein OEV94_01800 [Deltaproteobacteria bacterium]|nr:hypothetical protein [Deltaproteobacteria bacterium]